MTVARYARYETDPTTAEVAILVATNGNITAWRAKLMRPLMARARDAGISRDPPGEQDREALLWRSRADNPRTNVGGNAVITVDLDDALRRP